jgi:uncharacterized lipoprotein YajG
MKRNDILKSLLCSLTLAFTAACLAQSTTQTAAPPPPPRVQAQQQPTTPQIGGTITGHV